MLSRVVGQSALKGLAQCCLPSSRSSSCKWPSLHLLSVMFYCSLFCSTMLCSLLSIYLFVFHFYIFLFVLPKSFIVYSLWCVQYEECADRQKKMDTLLLERGERDRQEEKETDTTQTSLELCCTLKYLNIIERVVNIRSVRHGNTVSVCWFVHLNCKLTQIEMRKTANLFIICMSLLLQTSSRFCLF